MKKKFENILKATPAATKPPMKVLLEYIEDLEARVSALEKPIPTSEEEQNP